MNAGEQRLNTEKVFIERSPEQIGFAIITHTYSHILEKWIGIL